jgi:hypothetical protein
MIFNDKTYGWLVVVDPLMVSIIESPAFVRLKHKKYNNNITWYIHTIDMLYVVSKCKTLMSSMNNNGVNQMLVHTIHVLIYGICSLGETNINVNIVDAILRSDPVVYDEWKYRQLQYDDVLHNCGLSNVISILTNNGRECDKDGGRKYIEEHVELLLGTIHT